MSRFPKPPETLEERIDQFQKHGPEITGAMVDKYARLVAMVNADCAMCGKKNPGLVEQFDHGVRFKRGGGIGEWKLATLRGRGGVAMVCGEECAGSANFESRVLTGQALYRAVIK